MLKKSYTVVKKKGRQVKNKISFIASTENQDRYGDVVNQNGWTLAAYDRNPVVLFNHQANMLPIGKGFVRVKDGQLLIDVEFDQDDELARKIEKKARGGFLNAVSVGFNPIEAINRSELPKDHPAYTTKGGQFFNKSELLEVSIVTIPANSEATSMSYDKINLRKMIKSMIVEEVRAAIKVEAPNGFHWMDYKDGPVLMEGDNIDHEGASSSFEFDVIEEHDPDMLRSDMEEDKGHYDKEEESSEDEKSMAEDKEKDEENKDHYDEDEDDKKDKGFLTDSERDLLRYILQS